MKKATKRLIVKKDFEFSPTLEKSLLIRVLPSSSRPEKVHFEQLHSSDAIEWELSTFHLSTNYFLYYWKGVVVLDLVVFKHLLNQLIFLRHWSIPKTLEQEQCPIIIKTSSKSLFGRPGLNFSLSINTWRVTE